MGHRATIIRLLCTVVAVVTLGACAGHTPPVAQAAPAQKLAAQRQAAAVLAVDPSGLEAMSKAALERAYALRAGDGGAAPAESQASRPVPVVLAMAHPVDTGAVRVARIEAAPVRRAAVSPGPGLIKAAPAAPAPMVRRVKLEAPKPVAPEPKAEPAPPAPPKAAAAPPPDGTIAKLTRLLRRVLGIGAPG